MKAVDYVVDCQSSDGGAVETEVTNTVGDARVVGVESRAHAFGVCRIVPVVSMQSAKM